MTLLFLGLNEEGDGWEPVGKIADGEIVEDPTGELEATVRERTTSATRND